MSSIYPDVKVTQRREDVSVTLDSHVRSEVSLTTDSLRLTNNVRLSQRPSDSKVSRRSLGVDVTGLQESVLVIRQTTEEHFYSDV